MSLASRGIGKYVDTSGRNADDPVEITDRQVLNTRLNNRVDKLSTLRVAFATGIYKPGYLPRLY
jgi:hypothetical protein